MAVYLVVMKARPLGEMVAWLALMKVEQLVETMAAW
jgi:hypothetical protein